MKGRMKDKPTRWRRNNQMHHDLANDGGFVALKRAERYGDREKGCQKPAVQQKRLLMMIVCSTICGTCQTCLTLVGKPS